MRRGKIAAIILVAVTAVAVLTTVIVSNMNPSGSSDTEEPNVSALTEEEADGTAAEELRFLTGSTVNGVDVSGMTAEEASDALAASVQDYSFTLTLGENSYTGTGEDLLLSYNTDTDLTALLEAQAEDKSQLAFTVADAYTADVSDFVSQVENSYNAWLLAELTGATEEAAETEESETEAEETETETIDEELLAELAAPQNAYITYDGTAASYVIVADEPGRALDWETVTDQVSGSVLALEADLALDVDGLVEQAAVSADDADLLAALDDVNSCLNLNLSYTFTPDGGSTSTYTLSRATLGSLYYVDSSNTVQVDEEILGGLVSTLVSTYSVSSSKSQFKTTAGNYVSITVTAAGQSVNSSGLYNDMLSCLESKTGGTRTAPYEETDDDGDGYWGGNYVEIDLTSQHLWCYKNGVCVVSCDVVSGCVANGTTTPTGCFQIFAKNTDRYLNGTNVDGTSYRSWVSYFMPFSGGCGIHDATWRSSFGGTIYYYNGSHGCVGVTLSNAKTIYNNVSVGTHVVVYGGLSSASELPGRTQTVTATAASSSLTVGDTTTITVSSKTTPSYTSSDTSVATVNSSGKVTAVGAGTATITVSCPSGSGYAAGSATVKITVSEAAHVHTWVGQQTTVHHDAVTEEVTAVDQEAYTEYSCSKCGETFSSAAEAQAHIQEQQAIVTSHANATVIAVYPDSGTSGDGSSTTPEVTTPSYYTCSDCGEQFATEAEAQAHISAEQAASSDHAGATVVETVHEAVTHTETKTVTEAYNEVVITYVCSDCGAVSETKPED
ncbi:MAG: L,D-transpeptidase family protein [Clostridiales bacterium]|nr:L,D-transpeptidase family protein [Clostridiales bacterium]